jgi:hypothetical protein
MGEPGIKISIRIASAGGMKPAQTTGVIKIVIVVIIIPVIRIIVQLCRGYRGGRNLRRQGLRHRRDSFRGAAYRDADQQEGRQNPGG